MKIALLLNNNLSGHLIASGVMNSLAKRGITCHAFCLDTRPPRRAFVPAMADFFFYDFWLHSNVVKPFLIKHRSDLGQFDHGWSCAFLSPEEHIPFEGCEENLARRFDELSIDHALSIRNMFVFKRDFIQRVKEKRSLWNLHTGLLPNYRGAHALLWMMAEQEHNAAWTLHDIEPGIDEGAIVGHAFFPIVSRSCYISQVYRAVPSAVHLIEESLQAFQYNQSFALLPNHFRDYPYYSFPTQEDCEVWSAKGLSIAHPIQIVHRLFDSLALPDPLATQLRMNVIEAVAEWERAKITYAPDTLIESYRQRAA